MDFEKDIREYVLSALPHDLATRAELEAKAAPELLALYLNWINRRIPAQPRRVHLSGAMQRNPLSAKLLTDLEQIVAKIADGVDLTPHLSKDVKCGYRSATLGKPNRRRPDLDLMLADWQVHHLHVSNTLHANGLVTRDGPLLFAAFEPGDAYLIDIFGHGGDWTKEEIAQILIDEWPQCGFVHEVKGGIQALDGHASEAERAALRTAGISAPIIRYKGKFYMVGLGGMTSAGTAVIATRRANSIIRASRLFAKHVTENPSYIEETLIERGLQSPASPDLHIVFMLDGTCGVFERNCKVLFPLPGIPCNYMEA
jgi:hypothetical protein